MEIKQFKFTDDKGKVHEFTWNDNGFINATEAYKEWGKSKTAFDNWKTRTLIPYAERFIELSKIASPQNVDLLKVSDLITVKVGGDQTKNEAGTWLHPDLVNVFSRWINMDFEIWCDKIITILLTDGHVELDEEGEKYAKFRRTILNSCQPSSKVFMRILREMINIHEAQGYNIKSFEKLMSEVSRQLIKEDRVPMYEKIVKVLEDMYQDGELDMTTREAMNQRVYTMIIAVLKTRTTKAENKLKRIVLTPSVAPVVVVDKNVDNHNELVELTAELNKTKSELAAERKKADGISDCNTFGDMYVPTLEPDRIAASKCEAERTILSYGYTIIFNQFLSSTGVHKQNNPKLPDFEGVQLGDARRKSVGLWKNDGHRGFQLTKPRFDGKGWDVYYGFSLFPVDDKHNFVGLNKDNTVCGIYNDATNLFMLYGVTAEKK